MRRAGAVVVGLVAAALVAGCGGGGESKRFRVSGKATYDGKPIPYGDILFTPDGAKQNAGPQGFANIRDGAFDTSASGGKGYGGGPAVVRVTGFDKEGGKLLCEVELSIDLPAGDATRDIDVPKGKGKDNKAASPDI